MFPKSSNKNKPTNSKGTLGDSRGHRSKLTDKKQTLLQRRDKKLLLPKRRGKKNPTFLTTEKHGVIFLIFSNFLIREKNYRYNYLDFLIIFNHIVTLANEFYG